jgi:hypothetical protein
MRRPDRHSNQGAASCGAPTQKLQSVLLGEYIELECIAKTRHNIYRG